MIKTGLETIKTCKSQFQITIQEVDFQADTQH